jgi:hypothetical protein
MDLTGLGTTTMYLLMPLQQLLGITVNGLREEVTEHLDILQMASSGRRRA